MEITEIQEEEIAQNLVTSGSVEEIREKSRSTLALKLLYIFSIILTFVILISLVLIWFNKLTFDNGMTLILAISSTFSGLLGSALTFYFSDNQ